MIVMQASFDENEVLDVVFRSSRGRAFASPDCRSCRRKCTVCLPCSCCRRLSSDNYVL